ncbi:MAG: hypothetical protein ACE5J7_03470 [Candidatus Aenigmatarchaeota archaeon]
MMNKVKNEVYNVLGQVAYLFKVPIKDFKDKLPKVATGKEVKKTTYLVDKNNIQIKPEHEGDWGIYAEEDTHLLRTIYVPDSDDVVQEFLGGLARLMIGGGDITISDEYMKGERYRAESDKMVLNGMKTCKEVERASTTPLRQKEIDLGYELLAELEAEGNKKLGKAYDIIAKAEVEAEESIIDLDIERIEMGIALTDKNTYTKEAHKQAYAMAQRIYDAGLAGDLLEEHPDLIRLPDRKVLKIARAFSKRARR